MCIIGLWATWGDRGIWKLHTDGRVQKTKILLNYENWIKLFMFTWYNINYDFIHNVWANSARDVAAVDNVWLNFE